MDFMYFDLMSRAADMGYRVFDFGRSKIDSGPYHYKRHWGFEPEPLHYQYHLLSAASRPNLDAGNPKFQMISHAWRRLPLPVSQAIGPMVSKYLG
jgi:hypothetical protein